MVDNEVEDDIYPLQMESKADVGIVEDKINDLSDDDSDLVIDEPEEEETGRESEEEIEEERPEMKPSLPSVTFLADQRALLQPKTELQRKPEQVIQPKLRGGLGGGVDGGLAAGVGGGLAVEVGGGLAVEVGGGINGVAAQSRPISNTQVASSPPPFTTYFNNGLDILATVASMNR